nr:hypothetical protein [Tanacetum cinerariifolium]
LRRAEQRLAAGLAGAVGEHAFYQHAHGGGFAQVVVEAQLEIISLETAGFEAAFGQLAFGAEGAHGAGGAVGLVVEAVEAAVHVQLF